MFQIVDPAMIRALARETGRAEDFHRREAVTVARKARRQRLLGWLGYRSSRVRTRSTGVPSFSGTATSRS